MGANFAMLILALPFALNKHVIKSEGFNQEDLGLFFTQAQWSKIRKKSGILGSHKLGVPQRLKSMLFEIFCKGPGTG